jgi:hypothetical protein
MGDKVPNRAGDEIHLELVEKIEIYNEYKTACIQIYKDDTYLTYDRFIKLWGDVFPHVKIRVYKQVSGKCDTCTKLSALRIEMHSHLQRAIISELFAHHRTMYMGERSLYYVQRHLACQSPDLYMSIILDGMAQNHCVLPWQCNLKQFGAPLDQHIQGLIEHGQSFRVFRTFHTAKDDFNLAAHCLLLTLEARIIAKGRLPDTLFIFLVQYC